MINGKKINKFLFIKIVLWLSLIVFLGFLFYKGYLEDYVDGNKYVNFKKNECERAESCNCIWASDGYDSCICKSKVLGVKVYGYCNINELDKEQIINYL